MTQHRCHKDLKSHLLIKLVCGIAQNTSILYYYQYSSILCPNWTNSQIRIGWQLRQTGARHQRSFLHYRAKCFMYSYILFCTKSKQGEGFQHLQVCLWLGLVLATMIIIGTFVFHCFVPLFTWTNYIQVLCWKCGSCWKHRCLVTKALSKCFGILPQTVGLRPTVAGADDWSTFQSCLAAILSVC